MGKLYFGIGDLIESRYRVIEEIGAGGMGQLYRVADTGREDAELALKIVRLQGSGISETELLEKFQGEFRLLTQLWHPNLIEVHDYGVTEGGDFYYTMAYVDGPNLSDAMASMGIGQLVPTMVQICRALAYLHARGIFHGDLKPANVLLDEERVRLVDFGLAQEMQAEQGGQRYITPYYAAPELAQGRRVDGRADLYSLGAMAYTWLVGQPPDFMLAAERFIAMALKEALSAQRAMPPGIGDLIICLLAQDLELRFATANEVIEALNSATGNAFALETKETASSYALRARFVGREAEMAQLRTSWETAQGDQGQMVLIGGESGVGKTRLVNELEVQVELEGARVFWGQCLESGGSAYQPWREVLRVLLRYIEGVGELDLARLGPVLAILLPELWERSYMAGLAPPAELEPAAAQQRLNDAILRALQAAARTRPTVVVIEDAHWADEATQLLIGFLARLLDFGGLMVCITYRSEEMEADGFLAQLSGEYVQRIAVTNLTSERTNELVESMLGMARLPQSMMEQIQRTTAGNTFFVQELIRSLVEAEEVMTRTLDGWRVDEQALAEVGLPDSIRQVIWRRLERLTPDAQLVLRWAAVVGVVFWEGVLEQVGQVSLEQVRAALSEGLEQEVVILRDETAFVGEREYLFAKPVIQEVSYTGLPTQERSRLHQQVADWLIAHSDEHTNLHLGLIADHLEGAGQIEQAVVYLQRAGEQAAAQFANAEAIGYFSRAFDLTPEDDLEVCYDLLLAREKVHNLRGAREAQYRDLVALKELARALDDTSTGSGQAARQSEVALRHTYYAEATGDYPAAIAAAQQVIRLSRATKNAHCEAVGYRQWGYILWRQGEYALAQSCLERALNLAQALEARDVEANCLHALGNVTNVQGNLSGDMAYQERALHIFREIGDRQGEGVVLNALGAVSDEQGNFVEAKAYHELALPIFREIGYRRYEGLMLRNLGFVCAYLGDYAQANIYNNQALPIFREIGDRGGEGLVLGNLGNAYRDQGDPAKARTFYEQSLQIFREIGDRSRESQKLYDLSLLLHQIGDNVAAREYSQQALSITQEIGDRRNQGYALTNLAHALVGLGRLVEAAEYYWEALEMRREMGQPHLVLESLAGLAHISLDKNDLRQASDYVEEILCYLKTNTLDGTDEPFCIYLTCYRALQACQDARAQAVLETAYQWLQERAAKITDDELRRSLLENVTAHSEIIFEYNQSIPKEA